MAFHTKSEALEFLREWQREHVPENRGLKKLNFEAAATSALHVSHLQHYALDDIDRGWEAQPVIDAANALYACIEQRRAPRARTAYDDLQERRGIFVDWDDAYKSYLLKLYRDGKDVRDNFRGRLLKISILEASLALYTAVVWGVGETSARTLYFSHPQGSPWPNFDAMYRVLQESIGKMCHFTVLSSATEKHWILDCVVEE